MGLVQKKNLVGKRFIYVFSNGYVEVLYKKDNFKHLTGVECKLSAKDFYKNAIHDSLQESQIFFTSTHPYELCKRKIKHICELSTLASNGKYILEEICTETKTYKFGTTDLNFTLCLGREHDKNGNEIGECYIVESLRDGDCINRSKIIHNITHILSRNNNISKYTDIIYINKGNDIDTLPKEIQKMIHNDILQKK